MSDYFDIDAVLMEEDRVPVVLISDAFELGYLDSVSEEVRPILV